MVSADPQPDTTTWERFGDRRGPRQHRRPYRGPRNRPTPKIVDAVEIHVLCTLSSAGPCCSDSPDTPLEAESDEGGTEDDKPE